MNRFRVIAVPLLGAALAACSATGEAQRPAVVVAAVSKAVDGLVAQAQQRLATEPFRGLPIVVRNGAGEGTESVLTETLRTRLVDRGLPVEVACPAKCLEITLVEFVAEGGQSPPVPGQVLPAHPEWPALPRAPGAASGLAAGQVSAVLATFASRDANRYGVRQGVLAILAVAKSPEPAR